MFLFLFFFAARQENNYKSCIRVKSLSKGNSSKREPLSSINLRNSIAVTSSMVYQALMKMYRMFPNTQKPTNSDGQNKLKKSPHHLLFKLSAFLVDECRVVRFSRSKMFLITQVFTNKINRG